MQDTVIEMIENVNTLYVPSQIWADYAFSKVDEYPDLISKVHSIIVGPIEPEDTTENPNVVPFNSIDDVYHGYTHARSFTLQTEITTIGEETFTHMESLEEILVETEQDNNGREHQYYSSVDGILFSKDRTILIAYPRNRKEDGVVATTYTIPNSVTTIGEDAFSRTKLERVIIPTSVTTIGRNAFQHMHALTNITVDPSQNITFNTDTSYATDGVLVSGSAFSGTYSTTVGNESIDEPTTNNFYESMAQLVTPTGHSVRLLDTNGVQIGIPYPVNLNGNMVGLNGHVPTAVTIEISAATTTLLSNGTGWQYLLNLEEITLESPASGVIPHFTVVNGVLYNSAKTVALKYPPQRLPSDTHLVLEDTITSISERAFFDMRNILKITIPASVTVIKKEAFMHHPYNGHPDSDLQEVIFSSGSQLKTIQRHAFQRCRPENGTGRPGVTNFTIPKSVETIEAWAFYSMSTKISFESGSKIKKIGYQSMIGNQYGDSGFPVGLNNIQIDAFDSVDFRDFKFGDLNIPASVVTLERGSIGMDKILSVNFAKRSMVSGLSSFNNSGDLMTPWNVGGGTSERMPYFISAYGPLINRLEWGATNNGTFNQSNHDNSVTWTSAWNLGGDARIHRKYSSVVSFTMSTTTLVAGDSATVEIVFLDLETDFDSSLDVTIFDTNTGSVRSDLGTLSKMTTSDGGKTWTGTFTPVVDKVVSGIELRLDTELYKQTIVSSLTRGPGSNLVTVIFLNPIQNGDTLLSSAIQTHPGTTGTFSSNDNGTTWTAWGGGAGGYVTDVSEVVSFNTDYYNTNFLSDALVSLTMDTTRTPLTMYVHSKNLVKGDVAEIGLEFPDASSRASFTLDRVAVYNSTTVPVLSTDDGNVCNTSYELTHADDVDISQFGFVPNRVLYNTTVVEVSRKVRPLISLVPGDVILDVGDVFVEPGVSVLSGDGTTDVSSGVQTTTQLDTSVVGVYTVEYSYTEPSENIVRDALVRVAATKSRQVTVGIGAVLQVQGPERMWIVIEPTNTYNDLGATAIDGHDGEITNSIIVSGSDAVDTSVLGTYTITYSVRDSDGINMTATRTVYVTPPPTCFPAGTPVETDQGVVNIEKLSKINTIRGSPVLSVPRSYGHHSVISIPQSSLYKNVPSQDTYCSLEHNVFYNGSMIKARNLVNKCDKVRKISHDGAPLYNVLLSVHDCMVVNNLIVETLHPHHSVARRPVFVVRCPQKN